jgi:hypothetical protein
MHRWRKSLEKLDRDRRALANNPVAQSFLGFNGAAMQTWYNTWLGCTRSDLRCLSREMWGIMSIGFPLVEKTARSLISDPQYNASSSEIDRFERVMIDYDIIPKGFEPQNRMNA